MVTSGWRKLCQQSSQIYPEPSYHFQEPPFYISWIIYFFYFFERTSHATGVALPTAKESQTAGRLWPRRTDLQMEAQLSGIVWDNCNAWFNLQRGHRQVMQKQLPQHLVINHLLYWLHRLFLFFSPSYFSSFSKEQFLKT